MWRRILPALALLPALAFAQAPARTSLLFTPAEMAALTKALSDVGRPQLVPSASAAEPDKPVIPNIYLSAVAEFSPGQWVVWANGYRIVPGREAPDFKIVSVHDDQVEIAVDSDPPARFSLQPHQTWLSRSNSVVEGIFP